MTHRGAGSQVVVFMLLNVPTRKYSYQDLAWCLEYGRDWSNASTVHTYDCYWGDGFHLILVAVSNFCFNSQYTNLYKYQTDLSKIQDGALQLLSAMTH